MLLALLLPVSPAAADVLFPDQPVGVSEKSFVPNTGMTDVSTSLDFSMGVGGAPAVQLTIPNCTVPYCSVTTMSYATLRSSLIEFATNIGTMPNITPTHMTSFNGLRVYAQTQTVIGPTTVHAGRLSDLGDAKTLVHTSFALNSTSFGAITDITSITTRANFNANSTFGRSDGALSNTTVVFGPAPGALAGMYICGYDGKFGAMTPAASFTGIGGATGYSLVQSRLQVTNTSAAVGHYYCDGCHNTATVNMIAA